MEASGGAPRTVDEAGAHAAVAAGAPACDQCDSATSARRKRHADSTSDDADESNGTATLHHGSCMHKHVWSGAGLCGDGCFSRTFVMPCHRSCPGGNFTLDGLMHGRLDLVTRWCVVQVADCMHSELLLCCGFAQQLATESCSSVCHSLTHRAHENTSLTRARFRNTCWRSVATFTPACHRLTCRATHSLAHPHSHTQHHHSITAAFCVSFGVRHNTRYCVTLYDRDALHKPRTVTVDGGATKHLRPAERENGALLLRLLAPPGPDGNPRKLTKAQRKGQRERQRLEGKDPENHSHVHMTPSEVAEAQERSRQCLTGLAVTEHTFTQSVRAAVAATEAAVSGSAPLVMILDEAAPLIDDPAAAWRDHARGGVVVVLGDNRGLTAEEEVRACVSCPFCIVSVPCSGI
jgi:hypothetical protein